MDATGTSITGARGRSGARAPTAVSAGAGLGRRTRWALRRRVLSPTHLYLGDERVLDLRRLRSRRLTIDLLVIGAAKAGTTSLHRYLDQHPDIFMSSPVKEPGYFLPEARMLEWSAARGVPVRSRDDLLPLWMLRGYGGERAVGESTTAYTDALPGRPFDAPARAHAHNPGMRLVYLVRDPVERIVSNVAQSTRSGKPGADFEEWLDRRFDTLVARSRYWFQLERWLEHFPPEAVSVVVTEEMALDPVATLATIHAHVGVPPHVADAGDYPVHNETRPSTDGAPITADRVRDMMKARGTSSIVADDRHRLEEFLGREIAVWTQ